jgi:hypothetical protein
MSPLLLPGSEEGHDEGLDRADAGIEGEGAEQLLVDIHCGSLHTQCTIFEISLIRFRLRSKIFGGQCHFFGFLFLRLVLSQVNFTYSNFAWGIAWWWGREVVTARNYRPNFAKTSSFSMTEYERFGLVFTKTRVFDSGTGGLLVLELH